MIRRTVDLYRRRLLQGAGGVVFGLPALEAFMTKEAHAQAATKIYTVFMQQQNGCIQGTSGDSQLFWPSAVGPITKASLAVEVDKTVSELADHAGHGGLGDAQPPRDGGGADRPLLAAQLVDRLQVIVDHVAHGAADSPMG